MKWKWIARLIFGQALIAMLGSLYYGFYWDPVFSIQSWEYFKYWNWLAPCELCRYARILMYPLVGISLVGIIQDNWKFVYTVLPFAVIWIGLEVYHYALQNFDIASWFLCTLNNPCNALEVDYFNFITIPMLCGIAFIVITICCIVLIKKNRNTVK